MDKIKKTINKNKRLPAVRFALTPACNLSCQYCPPDGGENYPVLGKPLSSEKLLTIMNIFHVLGFRQFGFTGGEPLLDERLYPIIKECTNFKGISMKLYTNGVLLKEKMEMARRFDYIKLSLDTIDRERFKKITGRDKLGDVLEGIEMARRNNIKIRINTVYTGENHEEIIDLLDFCSNKKIDLKILDLNCFVTPGYPFWKTFYKSPAGIMRFLEREGAKKKVIYGAGGYGILMPEYSWRRIKIRIKDTHGFSLYSPMCKDCKYFLCQDGLYHLIFTCDGRLKICRHRLDLSLDLNRIPIIEMKKKIIAFLATHYFQAQRVYSQKQVFLGHFGKEGG